MIEEKYYDFLIPSEWQHIAKETLQKLQAINPAVDVEFKEKYGALSITFAGEVTDDMIAIAEAAEEEAMWLGQMHEDLFPREWEKIADQVLDEELKIEAIIRQVRGSMALSDMELTREDEERIRQLLSDPDLSEDILAKLIEKHSSVRYQWSEDGKIERCTKKEIEVPVPTECYHCGNPLQDEAVELTTADGSVYLLHKECFEKGRV